MEEAVGGMAKLFKSDDDEDQIILKKVLYIYIIYVNSIDVIFDAMSK